MAERPPPQPPPPPGQSHLKFLLLIGQKIFHYQSEEGFQSFWNSCPKGVRLQKVQNTHWAKYLNAV